MRNINSRHKSMTNRIKILIGILVIVVFGGIYLLTLPIGNCERDCVLSFANRREGIVDCRKDKTCLNRYEPICKEFCRCVEEKEWNTCLEEAGIIP